MGSGSSRQLLAAVERLLNGESLSLDRFGYDVSATHIGIVSTELSCVHELERVSKVLDCRLLVVEPDDDTIWAWLGTTRSQKSDRHLESLIASTLRVIGPTAMGEAARELKGLRLTHLQADAAMDMTQNVDAAAVRYPDVALLASVRRDVLLTQSLYQRYLAPLENQRKGGDHLRQTLKAYLDCGLSSTSAAALLRVDRRTVHSRLTRIEDLLGQSPQGITTELSVALRMHDAGLFSQFETPAPKR